MELVLGSLGLQGEVITTPYTFVSTTHAVVRNGLTPVFCDVREDDFNIDPEKIEPLINEKTCAILAVHVYGNPCDVGALQAIARKHGIKLIYDAAHAFGEIYQGHSIAEYGDASVFSFHASKVFNSVEGGCVACRDEKMYTALCRMRNFGINEQDVEYVATNAKMNEFSAAMGICNLRHLPEIIQAREKLTELYLEQLDDVTGLELPMGKPVAELQRNYAYFPVLVQEAYGESRDVLYARLNRNGVQALRNFYPLTSAFSCYTDLRNKSETPVAKWLSEHVLLLPLYADLQKEQVEYICRLVRHEK